MGFGAILVYWTVVTFLAGPESLNLNVLDGMAPFGKARHARACPGHPRLASPGNTWMAGTGPAMTKRWIAVMGRLLMVVATMMGLLATPAVASDTVLLHAAGS